jgi:DNA helicase HerA-like ATPase
MPTRSGPCSACRGSRHRAPLSAPEIAALAHLPLDRDVPGVSRAGARSAAPPPEIHREGKILGDAETGSRRPVALAPADACHHLHLLGATGSGKSTLLLNLVLGDIASGRGTVVIDPKGALVEDILDRLPEHASDRTVVIDAEDPEPPRTPSSCFPDPNG